MSQLLVDPVIRGNSAISNRPSVVAATVAAGTLATSFAAGQTIDGVVLVVNDLILIKNQASAIDNGLYVVQTSGAPIREDSLPTGDDASMVNAFVKGGTTQSGTAWYCSSNPAIVGTDAQVWTKFVAVGGEMDQIKFTMSAIPITVTTTAFREVAQFAWSQARYGSYTSGTVVFGCTINTKTLDVQLWNKTTASSLGVLTGTAASGIYTFSVTNPVANSQLAIRVLRSNTAGGANPIINGITLEYVY